MKVSASKAFSKLFYIAKKLGLLKVFALFRLIRLKIYVLLIVSLHETYTFNVLVKKSFFFFKYPIINCLGVISFDSGNYVYFESREVREQTSAMTTLLEAPLMQNRNSNER